MNSNKIHYIFIDIIRAISAILIVLYHYTYRYNQNQFIIDSDSELNWPVQFSWGCGAVITFFMLSGFLTSKYFSGDSTNNYLKTSKTYIINRLFRLYPSYWIGVSVTSVCMYLLMPEAIVSLKDFVLNLTMVPSLLGGIVVDGAYWTLQLELMFSLIVVVAILIKSSKFKFIMLIIWIVMSIFYNIIDIEIDNLYLKIFRIIVMPKFSSCFVCGIAIFQVSTLKDLKYIGLIILSLLSLFISNLGVVNTLFFICTIGFLSFYKISDSFLHPKMLIVRIMSWIASISYPLYLIHQMIGIAIIKTLRDNGLVSEIWIIIPVVIVLFVAFIIHKFIELPFSKIGKHISN